VRVPTEHPALGPSNMPRKPPDRTTDRGEGLVSAALAALRKQAAGQRRLSLVVYHHDGTESAPLDPGAPVVVGRREPASICVPSGKLSRAHARFSLDASGAVTVTDLGSTNGTWVGGERVERATIAVGDEVILGDAIATVLVTPRAEPIVATPAGAPGSEAPVARAPAMREVLAIAARVAASSVPVILQGETGSGKEVVARHLHEQSPRRKGALVCVNCAAIPGQLVESMLFGHERGAFTGAEARQKGVFEEADGGTVFLDEIAELGPSAQAALLRVLETGRFSRVGSAREIAVDVRIVAATHRDLEALRDAGGFRADLYYRLGVMVITVPPLRDRAADIVPLARLFMARAGGRVRDIAPEALALLQRYAWPGNVRELRNTIERASVLASGDVIRPEHLPTKMVAAASIPPPRATAATVTELPPPPGVGSLASAMATSADALRARLQEVEAATLREALEAAGWNQSEAARRLGMPIRTLSHKAKMLGLKKPG
jgi:two-component system, NtrC family, response regulator AtoC